MKYNMYNKEKPNELEISAYTKIDRIHNSSDDNELIDTLWHYMYSYLYDNNIDLILYADEFEIYTGIEGYPYENVVNFILQEI
jgi:hypothetical protein